MVLRPGTFFYLKVHWIYYKAISDRKPRFSESMLSWKVNSQSLVVTDLHFGNRKGFFCLFVCFPVFCLFLFPFYFSYYFVVLVGVWLGLGQQIIVLTGFLARQRLGRVEV